jgi:hypothetical protein
MSVYRSFTARGEADMDGAGPREVGMFQRESMG